MSNIKHYHFTYKTTCLINGRYYLGMHSTRKLNDGYLGSGTVLRRSLYKYGKENHKIEILEFFENRDYLAEAETRLITEDVLNDPLCMNLKPGGSGGFCNADHIKKVRIGASNFAKSQWLDPLFRSKFQKLMSNIQRDKILNGTFKLSFDWKGKLHKQETKNKIGVSNSIRQKGERNSQFGTMWITNGTENMKVKKESIIPEGWINGRKIKNDENFLGCNV